MWCNFTSRVASEYRKQKQETRFLAVKRMTAPLAWQSQPIISPIVYA